MAIIQTAIEYLLPGGLKRNRSIRYDDVTLRDSLEFYSPDLESRLNDIKAALPPARGLTTAAQSLSVITATDRPFDTRKVGFEGNGVMVVSATLGSNPLFINVSRFERFSIQIENATGAALNAFEISTKNHTTSDTRIRYNTLANYSTLDPNGIIRTIGNLNGAFENPFTLANTAKIIIDFDLTRLGYVHEIRFNASKIGVNGNINYFWGAN